MAMAYRVDKAIIKMKVHIVNMTVTTRTHEQLAQHSSDDAEGFMFLIAHLARDSSPVRKPSWLLLYPLLLLTLTPPAGSSKLQSESENT